MGDIMTLFDDCKEVIQVSKGKRVEEVKEILRKLSRGLANVGKVRPVYTYTKDFKKIDILFPLNLKWMNQRKAKLLKRRDV